MKTKAISTCILIIALVVPEITLANTFSGWFHGKSGYSQVIAKVKKADKPLILYFNTEWCGWCKKMNGNYLAASNVQKYLGKIPRVEVNPDNGPAENALSKKYNVTGYPTFLVSVPSLNDQPARLYPFREGADWTTAEFINAIMDELARTYNKQGRSSFQKEQYSEAIRFYDLSIRYKPNNPDAYFGKGLANQAVGAYNLDGRLLEKAKSNYQKALQINPSHQDSKNQLTKLLESMQTMGL